MPAVLVSILAALSVAASDTSTYIVLNHGRPAGEMVVVRDGESVIVRYQYTDRNRGQRVESRYRITAAGAVVAGESRDIGPNGVAAQPSERFEVIGDSVRWTTPTSRGIARRDPNSFYALRTRTPFDELLLAQFILRQPDRVAKLVNGGTLRAEIIADTTLPTRAGRSRMRLAMVQGLGLNPFGVWLDERNNFVASDVGWFMTIVPGAEAAVHTMRAIEVAFRNANGAEVAARVAPKSASAIAITNGDVFDSEQGVLRPRSTIVIRGDRIVAVGPAGTVPVPADATIIDAAGKTVMPGMYDMHTHLQLTGQSNISIMQLAGGITTVRDLASDADVAVSHRDRARAGTIVSPRMILAGFIEGPGKWAGPSDVLVRTEDEARAWVVRYDSLGYKQIKLYNLLHPDLVPTIADEAHKRGLRLSGHIPRGLSVPAAVRLGFDEINHAAFLFSTFYQDSLYTPTMRAYSAVAAAVAPSINVDGPEMTSLIALLRERGTVVDGTFNLWMRADTLGAQAERARAANANYLRLIKRLFDAGVTIVAGTDGSSYNGELETYERAGIPPIKVLQIATIVPARVMREEQDYGSLAPGKVADLVIVDGRPTERVADLRKIDRVVRAGRVYVPGDLFSAIGLNRREQRAPRAASPRPATRPQ